MHQGSTKAEIVTRKSKKCLSVKNTTRKLARKGGCYGKIGGQEKRNLLGTATNAKEGLLLFQDRCKSRGRPEKREYKRV